MKKNLEGPKKLVYNKSFQIYKAVLKKKVKTICLCFLDICLTANTNIKTKLCFD
jgi:hypothetical protein